MSRESRRRGSFILPLHPLGSGGLRYDHLPVMSFVEYAYPISPCGLTHPPAALCAYMPCGSILCPMASEFRLRRTVASCGELYDVLCGRRVLGQIQLQWVTGGAVGMDAGIQVSRGPDAYPRLRGYPRSCPAGSRPELAYAERPRGVVGTRGLPRSASRPQRKLISRGRTPSDNGEADRRFRCGRRPSLRSSTAQVQFGRHVPQIQDRRARAF
jgi:hypothetical protein